MERAAWDPIWGGLDLSIAVGLTDEFAFYRVVPEPYRDRGPERLVFYTGSWSQQELSATALLAHGTITAILHPDLGQIRELDTTNVNFSYLIHLVDGTTLSVDTEQQRGQVEDAWAYDSSGARQPARSLPSILDWRMIVEFNTLEFRSTSSAPSDDAHQQE